jgi:hypothetical protein
MFGSCCGNGSEWFHDQFDFSVKETEKGIQIDVTPKDPGKTESLKSFAKGLMDFCKCC